MFTQVFESERSSGCRGRGTAQSTPPAFLSRSPTLPVVGLPPFPAPNLQSSQGLAIQYRRWGFGGLNPGNVGFLLCNEGEIEKGEGKEAAGQTDKFRGHTPPLLPSAERHRLWPVGDRTSVMQQQNSLSQLQDVSRGRISSCVCSPVEKEMLNTRHHTNCCVITIGKRDGGRSRVLPCLESGS